MRKRRGEGQIDKTNEQWNLIKVIIKNTFIARHSIQVNRVSENFQAITKTLEKDVKIFTKLRAIASTWFINNLAYKASGNSAGSFRSSSFIISRTLHESIYKGNNVIYITQSYIPMYSWWKMELDHKIQSVISQIWLCSKTKS